MLFFEEKLRKAPCEAGVATEARCAGAGCGFGHGFGDESTPDSQSGISRSRTALTPPPALRPALPLPVYHTSTECTRSRAGYREATGSTQFVNYRKSEVILSQRPGWSLSVSLFALYC